MKKWSIYTVVILLVIMNGGMLFQICKMDKKLAVLNEQIKKPNLSQITIPGESLTFRNTNGTKVAEIINTPNGGS